MINFFSELQLFLSSEQIILPSNNAIKEFSTEYRGNFTSSPMAIVLPKTTQQTSFIVKLCNQYNIGIVPQGGNSGLVGGSVACENEIILSSKFMNKIVDIQPNNYSARVESGVILEDIHAYVDKYDLFFPLDLASKNKCSIGGNVATNAGGINVLKYGMTKDLILGLQAVLPNGDIYEDLNLLRKRNIGADFKNLFIGSEGLLGFITQINIKLFNKPKSFINVIFGTDKLQDLENIFHNIKHNFHDGLNAYEIFNHNCMDITKHHYPEIAIPINTNNKWYVLFSLESIHDNDSLFNASMIKDLHSIMQLHKIDNVHISQKRDMWDIRYNLPNAQKKLGLSLKHDISVSLDKTIELINTLEQTLLEHYPWLIPTIFGHWGDGNLHYNLSASNEEQLNLHKLKIKTIIVENVLKNNGTFSAEHGIGLLHKNEFKHYYAQNQYKGLKLIKNLLDNKYIFNNNKIFSKE